MRHDETGRRGAGLAVTGAAGSLAATLASRWSGADPGSGWRTAALAETGALLVLVALAVRRAPRRPAMAAAALGGLALTGLWLLRFDPPGASPVMLAGLGVWAAVAAAAMAAGTYLRSLDRHFARELAAARAEPEPQVEPEVEPGPSARRDGAAPLTARELEIATLVADGRTNAEIAAELYLAPGTVKNHVANIQRKLGTRNRVGIAAWILTPSDRP